jgi:hypothetical protein
MGNLFSKYFKGGVIFKSPRPPKEKGGAVLSVWATVSRILFFSE